MRLNNLLVVVLVTGTDLIVNAAPVNGRELVRLADGRVLSKRDPDWKTTAKTTALVLSSASIHTGNAFDD